LGRPRVSDKESGTVSGSHVSRKARPVIAHHVVQGASAAQVHLSDNHAYEARNVWGHPDQDTAVVSIDADKSADLHSALQRHKVSVTMKLSTIRDARRQHLTI